MNSEYYKKYLNIITENKEYIICFSVVLGITYYIMTKTNNEDEDPKIIKMM